LAETLEDWQSRLGEYGIDESFDVAIAALESGWDDPALAAVLAGQSEKWPPSDEGDWLQQELTAVRLRVLDACGKTEEYLRLARAAGAHARYSAMLVKLGRMPEAVEYALKSFKGCGEALQLATVLRNAAAHDDALKIAEAGLRLAGDEESAPEPSAALLARWLRDYAGAMGKTDLALKAARKTFEASLSLEDFRAAQALAGERWSAIRTDLLAHLDRAAHAYDRTRIYLSEGLIDAAVRSVGDRYRHHAHDETLMRLAAAAHASHSDWVIAVATAQAASLMDSNNAPYYPLAAQWLEKAALAYEAAGREDQWIACIDDLLDRHRRKYKLRPLLEALRGGR
jgi:uncharacterized Zn finger protein